MRLFDDGYPAPNPRRVRIFLAEKGIAVDRVKVSLRDRAQKQPEFLSRNSLGQLPVLELDDGTHISESISICRYIEALYPEPPLFGTSPKEAAIIDMWCRRIEQQLMAPIGQVWIHTHPITAALVTQFRDYGESNRGRAIQAFEWLDHEISGRSFMGGDAFSMADIVALTTIDFGVFVGVPIPSGCPAIRSWAAMMAERPSAQA